MSTLAMLIGTIAAWTVFGLGLGILIGHAIRRGQGQESPRNAGICRCGVPYDDHVLR